MRQEKPTIRELYLRSGITGSARIGTPTDITDAMQEWFENDDGVAVTWLWSGTHLGDLPGFPATGKTLRMSGATAYQFDNTDRISGHWQVTDRLGIFRQLQQAR